MDNKISVSVDSKLLKEFIKYCDEEDKNRSKVIERLIRKYLEEKGIIKRKG